MLNETNILGKNTPIPNGIKNFALVSIILVFIGCIIFLSYLKEWDKVVALAGILVGIVSSPIFSIRAEIEKYKQSLIANKKLEAYQALVGSLQKMTLDVGVIADKEQPKKWEPPADRSSDLIRFNNLSDDYYLYFSENIRNHYDKYSNLNNKIQQYYYAPNKDFSEKEKQEFDLLVIHLKNENATIRQIVEKELDICN